MIPDSHVSSVLCETGLTYRRLDYWTRRGYLHAQLYGPDGPISPEDLRARSWAYNPDSGTGYQRRWSRDEIAVAKTMRRLVDAGLSLEAAHTAARGLDAGKVALGDGLTLLVEASR